MILILMGVSGTGKTTVGELLSARIRWPFEDGDDYHSEANRLKMASGTPLTDEDREPWLQAIRKRLGDLVAGGVDEIFACSALRQRYRDILTAGLPPGEIQFAILTAGPEVLEERLLARSHPFMNPNLLVSQLATLEWPTDAWEISVEGTPEMSVAQIERLLEGRAVATRSENGSAPPQKSPAGH